MRWHALQVCWRTPRRCSVVQELKDLVGGENEAFLNRVLHFSTSPRGILLSWFKQRSGRLIAMVNTLGLPTVFYS